MLFEESLYAFPGKDICIFGEGLGKRIKRSWPLLWTDGVGAEDDALFSCSACMTFTSHASPSDWVRLPRGKEQGNRIKLLGEYLPAG